MSGPSVEVRDVALAYRLERNPVSTAKEFAIRAVKRQNRYEKLWALREVSFEVEEGEVLGVIGPNGAGKSTLMKMLARVLPPTEGRVIVRGAVSPMIELGAGFNTDLTGYENIVMYGTLLGRTPQHMKNRAEEITEWAGLSDYIDVPLRSYSSGMLARLGFAVATDVDPDVLIVDEVLAVGDEAFKRKSEARIKKMIASGTSVVLVSHALQTVAEMAERALWLDKGVIRMEGPAPKVVEAYASSVT